MTTGTLASCHAGMVYLTHPERLMFNLTLSKWKRKLSLQA